LLCASLINALSEITVKELDSVEIAENSSWKMIKPMFRKEAVLLKSIFQCYLRFNSLDKANKMAVHKDPKQIDFNLKQIMDVLRTSTENSTGQRSNQKIDVSFVNNEKEQPKTTHSSKNQFKSVAEACQPVNDFSIKSIQSEINCGALSSIFTQHETSKGHKEKQNIEQIKHSNGDDFIGSQFVNSRIFNVEDESTVDSVNHGKLLIDPNQTLNEWLRDSRPNRMQFTDDDEVIPKTSLLSESGKKIHRNKALSSCFL